VHHHHTHIYIYVVLFDDMMMGPWDNVTCGAACGLQMLEVGVTAPQPPGALHHCASKTDPCQLNPVEWQSHFSAWSINSAREWHCVFVARPRSVLACLPTGAGGDNGIAKMWNRREISVSSYDDQSHDLHPHPHPYVRAQEVCARALISTVLLACPAGLLMICDAGVGCRPQRSFLAWTSATHASWIECGA
jgi:hypothetical protein